MLTVSGSSAERGLRGVMRRDSLDLASVDAAAAPLAGRSATGGTGTDWEVGAAEAGLRGGVLAAGRGCCGAEAAATGLVAGAFGANAAAALPSGVFCADAVAGLLTAAFGGAAGAGLLAGAGALGGDAPGGDAMAGLSGGLAAAGAVDAARAGSVR